MIRRSICVALAALGLAGLLFLALGAASPASRAASIQRPGGASPVRPPATPTASPAPTLTPSPPAGTTFGGRGPGATCSNPVGGAPLAVILQQDFHWGSDHLSPRFRHDTVDRLCNDFWAWFDPAGQQVPARQVLRTLHWPADLLAHPWLDGDVPVGWMPIAFPTAPTPLCPGGQNCGAPTDNPACLVPLIFGQSWNICDPVRALINASANALAQGYRRDAAQVSFLWQTPLAPFQDESAAHLLRFWNSSWSIVLLCVVAVVAWGALRSMVGSVVSWLSYAQVIELVPRLIFALLAALLSRPFFVLLIQANNALCQHFPTTLLQVIVGRPDPGIKLGLVQILFGLLGFALLVEEAVRVAMLYVLFAASPLLFFLAALPETQRWAQGAARAAILLAFLQAIQAFILDVGNLLFSSVLTSSQGSLTLLHLLVALALLYLALVIFFVVIRLAFGISGSWVAGFPLLAVAALRWGTRGVWPGRAGNTGAVAPPPRFGPQRRVAGVGPSPAPARTRGSGPPRPGAPGSGGRPPGGRGRPPGGGRGPGPGPLRPGPAAPRASSPAPAPLGSGGTSPTGTPARPVPRTPGAPPRRGRSAALPRPAVPTPPAPRRVNPARRSRTP